MDFNLQSSENIYSVSELNVQAKQLLESGFGTIRLRGEIGDVTQSKAGHYYFSLKDDDSEIKCVLFASAVYRNRIQQKPEYGIEVVLEGKVTLYVQRGNFQFLVEDIKSELTREGALFQQFQLLKKELEEKGYFREERKKPLPRYPRQVGIVTSPSGAAVKDIIKTFKRRNSTIQLLIYPTLVQGETAPFEIAAAINLANQRQEVDVLVVSRGGGSLEDLAAFNDRAVADAVYESKIPIVTGIGHQTDLSIADLVADQMMATPTAAAEHISTPSIEEMLKFLSTLESSLQIEIQSKLNDLEQRLDIADRSLKHPEQKISDLQNQFRAFHDQLVLLTRNSIIASAGKIDLIHQQLLNQSPAGKIESFGKNISTTADNLHRSTMFLHEKYAAKVESLAKQLETMNPHATLSRGYAIIRRNSDNAIVSDASSVSPGDKVKAELAKGSLDLDVQSAKP